MIDIRKTTTRDRDAIRDIHLRAFADGEGRAIAAFVDALLDEPGTPQTLSLIAIDAGAAAGHIAFSPVTLDRPGDTGPGDCCGYILAPLAVHPECQSRGVGSQLIESGLRELTARGVDLLFVYGDPAYYGRFGFTAASVEKYRPPYPLQQPIGWLAQSLSGREPQASVVELGCVAALRDPALW